MYCLLKKNSKDLSVYLSIYLVYNSKQVLIILMFFFLVPPSVRLHWFLADELQTGECMCCLHECKYGNLNVHTYAHTSGTSSWGCFQCPLLNLSHTHTHTHTHTDTDTDTDTDTQTHHTDTPHTHTHTRAQLLYDKLTWSWPWELNLRRAQEILLHCILTPDYGNQRRTHTDAHSFSLSHTHTRSPLAPLHHF